LRLGCRDAGKEPEQELWQVFFFLDGCYPEWHLFFRVLPWIPWLFFVFHGL
jgi:hypothetical protein